MPLSCPSCGTEAPTGARFCLQCGSPLPLVCGACGEALPQGARFCSACGSPVGGPPPGSSASPSRPPAEPAEERRFVSILFADLAGFTERSDQADPEDVRRTLLPFHALAKEEIERYGGTLDKFIGDAVMGVFGAPVAHEDDAERAIRAALKIQGRVEELNQADPTAGIRVRAAVNSGEAVVTFASGPQVGENVAGDVVNTASRLQSVAPVGSVVVGESTYRATRHTIDYRELPPATVKGKAEPLVVWLVAGVMAEAGDRPAAGPDQPPLVGRSAERNRLRQLFARTVATRSVQLVTLVGDPGIGKSRLVADLHEHVTAGDHPATWRRGRCLPYGEGVTFWPLAEMVKAQAGVLETDDRARASGKLRAAVERTGLPDGTEAEDSEWIAARLAVLLGLDEGAPERTGQREEIFAALARFLERLARASPLVLVFEDLHWADQAVLGFVDELVERLSGAPVMVVGTSRPELFDHRPGWGTGSPNAATISLTPLSEEETAELLGWASGSLDRQTQARLARSVGGNPLFALEFVRMLENRPGEGERGRTGPADAVPVPETVQALIAARLDGVPSTERGLLQDASVIGETFWPGGLARMAGKGSATTDGAGFDGALEDLTHRGLIRRVPTSSVQGQPEFAFAHGLIRDVAYRQIPRRGRARRHLAVARWIEEMAGDRAADRADLLAHHYRQAFELCRASGMVDDLAEVQESARRAIVLSADRAAILDAGQAADRYAEALSLTPVEHPAYPETLSNSTRMGWRAGRLTGSEAMAAYREVLDRYRRDGDELGAAETLQRLGYLLGFLGEPASAQQAIEDAVEILSRHPGRSYAYACAKLAEEDMFAGRVEPSLERADAALALARQYEAPEAQVVALHVRGTARCELGDLGGLDDFRDALRVSEERGSAYDILVSNAYLAEWRWPVEGPARGLEANLAAQSLGFRRGQVGQTMWVKCESLWMLWDAGRWDDLLAAAEEILAWEARHGESQVGAVAGPHRAQVLAYRGPPGPVAEDMEAMLARVRKAGDIQVVAPGVAIAAVAAHLAGQGGRAADLVAEYEELTRDGAVEYRTWYLADMCRAAVAAGDTDLAARLAEGAEAHVARHRGQQATARSVLAEATGEFPAALEGYRADRAGWERFGFPLEQAHALLGEARCLKALGQEDDGAKALAAANDILDRLGATTPVTGPVGPSD